MLVRPFWFAALALFAAGCPSSSPPHVAEAPRGKIVVLLVVDQLPSWTFTRHVSAFHGGFARLVREGVYWPRGAFPYAATVTAAGHTALSTGAAPRESGIIGNSWWNRAEGRFVDATADKEHLTVPTYAGDNGASPHWRQVEAVGMGRRVLSVSSKERAAALMAPSRGPTVAWYEPEEREFVTSTAYATARPAWLDALAREHPITPRLDYVWTPLAITPHRALVVDSAAGEVGVQGLGPSFPHRLSDSKKPGVAVNATPLATEALLEAVVAGLDAVRPELLDVSFSTHDFAAHAWGQESWEATDVLFRMDETIGKFLDALDARYGTGGWSLVLAADHGGPPMPERNEGAQRIDLEDVQRTIKTAAGDPKWIVASDERNVWLSDDAPEKVKDDVVAALGHMPGIGFAMRTDRFAKGCAGTDGVTLLVCESVYPGRSGDVYYGPREHSFVMHRPFEADYHGTPYDYDRHVPLIVREPGRPGRVVEGETPSILRVAPTVARLLGVPPPPAAHEPSL